ncbi:hypothetical protein RCIP0023_00335 [Klebsiella phage RCIP0023]
MTSNTNPLIEQDSQFFYEKITNSIELLKNIVTYLNQNDMEYVAHKTGDLYFYITNENPRIMSFHTGEYSFMDFYTSTEKKDGRNSVDIFNNKKKTCIDFNILQNTDSFFLSDSRNGAANVIDASKIIELPIIKVQTEEERFQYSTVYNDIELRSIELYYKFMKEQLYFYVTLDGVEEIQTVLQTIHNDLPKYIRKK